MHAKLSDFGTSRAKAPLDVSMTMVGTPIFCAPEVLKGEGYDEKADLYRFCQFSALFGQQNNFLQITNQSIFFLTIFFKCLPPLSSFGMLLLDMASPNGILDFLKEKWQNHFKKDKPPPSLRLVTSMADGWRSIQEAGDIATAPPSVGNLIIRCCCADSTTRPSFAEVFDKLAACAENEVNVVPAEVYRRKSVLPPPHLLGQGGAGIVEGGFVGGIQSPMIELAETTVKGFTGPEEPASNGP